MSEWMPIETADKAKNSGQPILLYGPNWYAPVHSGGWDAHEQAWRVYGYGCPAKQPTHWMPLPKPPGEASEPKFPPYQTTKAALDAMTDDERMDLFRLYCRYCGCDDPRCQCWNDE